MSDTKRTYKPRVTFADHLEKFLQEAPEQEIRDACVVIGANVGWRKFAFRMKIEPVKMAETPLLDQEQK